MMKIKNWDTTKQRMTALWNGGYTDRCAISVTAPLGTPSITSELPTDISMLWTNPEVFYNREMKRLNNTYFAGDAIPIISPFFGPNGLAAQFGCPCTFTESTAWFDPSISDWENTPLRFNENDELLKKMYEVYDYVCERSHGNYFVGMPDNTSALDTLAHIRSSSELMIDMLTEPDRVKQATREITKRWLEINAKLFDMTSKVNDGGTCIGWLNTWAPGTHSQLQCDLSVMISNQLFREFALEELYAAAHSMKYPLYHLDGEEQVRHLDDILKIPGLKMIQWVSVAGKPRAPYHIDTLKKIQAHGIGVLINEMLEDEIKYLIQNLSAVGLYIVASADSVDDADRLVRIAEEYSRS